jgi:hypothetical protein
MERLSQLIGKLNEQFAQNADPFQLLVTTQLIETELVQMSTSTHRTAPSSKGVSVVMPAANGHGYQNRHKTEQNGTPAVVNSPTVVNFPDVVSAPEVATAPAVVETPVVVEIPDVVSTQAVVNATAHAASPAAISPGTMRSGSPSVGFSTSP